MTAFSGSIQLLRKTAAQWTSDNTVLLSGQPGVETDTGRMKVGDGTTAWNSRPYVGNVSASSQVITGGVISVGTYGGSGTNNDIRVTASTFYISGNGSYSAAQTDFLDIALSSAGNVRYVGLYGTTSNTVTKVEGTEGTSATLPTQPANTVVIGFVLVTDAGVSTSPGSATIDPTPTDGSSNAVSSNGVYDSLALKSDRNPRVDTIASSSTPTINIDSYDVLRISALATNPTISYSGTPAAFRPIIVVILDNGTSRTLTWDSAKFVAMGETLPTSTTINKVTTVAFLYYPSKSKFGCVGVKVEA